MERSLLDKAFWRRMQSSSENKIVGTESQLRSEVVILVSVLNSSFLL